MPWVYIQTKDKFDGPIFGGLIYRGGLTFGRKKTSICNLLNLPFFLFFTIKQSFWHFSRHARFEICSKLKQ